MIFLFILFQFVLAVQIPTQSLVIRNDQIIVVNEAVKFKPLTNYHFNIKSPQQCGQDSVVETTAMEITCRFRSTGPQKVTLYVCDDKESFCKPEKFQVEVSGPKNFKKSSLTKSSRETMMYVPKGERQTPAGFFSNDPKAALAQAKRQKKSLYIYFSTQWCPYCNMFEEYVFNEKEFKDKTKSYIKLKLDADSDISWELKEKFKIGGYPTTVVTDSELNEIDRLVGYRPLKAVDAWLDQAMDVQGEPINLAETKIRAFDKNPVEAEKEQNTKRRLRVGLHYFERGEYEQAVSYLENINLPKAMKTKAMAEIELAKVADDRVKLIAAYEDLIAKYPEEIEFASWVLNLIELDKDKGSKYVDMVEKNVSTWAGSDKIDFEDPNEADLRTIQAEIFEAIGQPGKAKEKYARCAAYYEPLSAKSPLKVARGVNLERAYCLLKSGETQKAKDLYKTMAQTYHGEFVFSYNFARALMDLNQLGDAYKYVKTAYTNAYGDNLIRAATLKAKLEMKMNKMNIAKKTIVDTLSKIVLPNSTQIRTHRYYGQLKALLSEVGE